MGHYSHTIGFGEAGPFVDFSVGEVVAGLGENLGDLTRIQSAGVRGSGSAVADHADTDAFALRRHEVFDLAFVDPHIGGERATHVGLDLLPWFGHGHHPVGNGQQFDAAIGTAHAAVPPMVSDFTRRVG